MALNWIKGQSPEDLEWGVERAEPVTGLDIVVFEVDKDEWTFVTKSSIKFLSMRHYATAEEAKAAAEAKLREFAQGILEIVEPVKLSALEIAPSSQKSFTPKPTPPKQKPASNVSSQENKDKR